MKLLSIDGKSPEIGTKFRHSLHLSSQNAAAAIIYCERKRDVLSSVFYAIFKEF